MLQTEPLGIKLGVVLRILPWLMKTEFFGTITQKYFMIATFIWWIGWMNLFGPEMVKGVFTPLAWGMELLERKRIIPEAFGNKRKLELIKYI